MTSKPLETLVAGLLLLLSNTGFARGSETHLINNPRGLIKLSNEVSSGDLHTGVTVFLDADIDFSDPDSGAGAGAGYSEAFEPIGNSWKKYFRGTFDGHGHVIRNLDMNSTSQFAGLFGYSGGLTLRNVILDDTCTITNGHDSLYESYTSGIIGYCSAQDGSCTIENCVNMAHVAFTGYVKSGAALAGIVAHINALRHDTVVRNCANYGTVSRDGFSVFAYMGGIIGACSSKTAHVYVHNCLNYGTILYESTNNKRTRIGGIVGYSESSITIVNTANAGRIDAENQSGDTVAAIMGNFDSKAAVVLRHCFWTDSSFELAVNNTRARLEDETRLVYLNRGTVDDLNKYAEKGANSTPWSRWILNKGKKTVAATISRETTLAMAFEVFLLPDVLGTEAEFRFSGWFTDANYTTKFTAEEVAEDTALYSGWSYTLSFESNGGAPIKPRDVVCGSTVELPSPKDKTGCVFERWDDVFDDEVPKYYTIPNFNVTLYAVWLCKNLSTPQDLIDFAKIVRGGRSYKGTTVFLNNDLIFDEEHSRKFLPVGDDAEDTYNTFAGTFDGNGYVIDELKIQTSSHYTGLFGLVRGAMIKNVVMGPSYSVQSAYVAFPDIGGIVGRGIGNLSDMIIENCVNMGDINYAENTGSFLFIGGIVGLITRTGDVTLAVRNCAYYGTITFSGKESVRIFVGGIAGESEGSSTDKSIQNCANYGAFVNKGERMGTNIVGGILGAVWDSPMTIYNCLSMGTLGRCAVEGAVDYIGAVAGQLDAKGKFVNCYWTKDVGDYNVSGFFTGSKLEAVESFIVPIDKSTTDRMNANTRTHDTWNKWFMLHLGGGRIGTVDRDTLIVAQKYFPDPVKEGHTFRCWCLDQASCASKYDQRTSEVDENTHIYAAWDVNNYTLSFDTHGADKQAPRTVAFNDTVSISEPSREGCAFKWWEDDRAVIVGKEFTMPARNVTLHAVWYCRHISSGDDLIGLSKVVNRGNTILTETVYLDKDIEIATSAAAYAFEPIGADEAHSFNGTFDAQGFTIAINAELSTKYAGLFGYLRGALINAVLADSFITSDYSEPGDAYLGGLVGSCDSCKIKNSLSTAEVTFTGSKVEGAGSLYLGGLAGKISDNMVPVDNCANYGSVAYFGEGRSCMIGGLVGYFHGKLEDTRIKNCLSYALISVEEGANGATDAEMHVGGIAGMASGVLFEGCVSAGRITTYGGQAESIVGDIKTGIITKCYWTEGVGCNNTHEVLDSRLIKLDNTTVAELNAVGGRWLLNINEKTVTFKIHDRTIVLSAPLILFPEAEGINSNNGKGEIFGFWGQDEAKFDGDAVYEDVTLEATFYTKEDYTITYVVLGAIIVAVICIVVTATILVHHCFYRAHKKRKEIKMYIEPLLYDKPDDSLDSIDYIYPPHYRRIPLEKALVNAGVNARTAREVVEDCYARTRASSKETKLPHGISIDDAAAICLYTMETKKMDVNPYAIINEALMDGTADAITPVKDFLYLVMTSLRKLPIFYGKPLYRGIRMNVINKGNSENYQNPSSSSSSSSSASSSAAVISLTNSFMYDGVRDERAGAGFEGDYTEGEEITWRALSSTSPNVAVTKAFLAKGTTSGKAEGTLFIIENGWGYNVQSCSMFPREAEIVLEPERRFRVKAVIPGEGLTIIKIEMLRTPIVLTDVFGEINFGKLV